MVSITNSSHKIAYSISEVMAVTGLGRTKLYEEINGGYLPARKLGRRTIVLRADLEKYLSDLPLALQKNVGGDE